MRRSKVLTSGDFRTVVILQIPKEKPDGSGGFHVTWESKGEPFWCSVDSRGGGEATDESSRGRMTTEETITLITWSRGDIDETTRLLMEGSVWNVVKVADPDRLGKYIEITATRGVET